VTPRPTLIQAIKAIKSELKWRLDQLHNQGRLLEAQRLEQRTTFDLEMMEATGSCAGIENYSRYLTGPPPRRAAADTVRIRPDNGAVFRRRKPRHLCRRSAGMFKAISPQGDAGGIRIPAAVLHDNRPLRFEEWDMMPRNRSRCRRRRRRGS